MKQQTNLSLTSELRKRLDELSTADHRDWSGTVSHLVDEEWEKRQRIMDSGISATTQGE